MKKLLSLGSLIVLLGFSQLSVAQLKPSEYFLAHKFQLEGDGFWDYLAADEPNNRLFISHGMMVQVINASDGTLLGTIPDTKGVHGIALAPELNKAYISCGRDSSVTIIDYTTLAFIKKVMVTGSNPDAILYDPFSQKVFAYNGRTGNATVIDAKTDKVVATIPLDGKPEFSQTDGKGRVYVNNEDKSRINVINAQTLKVETSWSLAPGEEPSGLALDNVNHRLFAVCGNKLMIILDANTGQFITSLPIGDGCDGVAYDPVLKRAYSSNGEGTMTTVQEESPNQFKVLENVPTQRGARTICVNKLTHHLYLSTAEFEEVQPTADNTHPRPKLKPGTFTILDIAPAQ
jgi:YVTN family beta-propeller protein